MEQASIPRGLCHCGCGGETNIAPVTNRRRGVVAGQPYEFIRGHGNARLNKSVPAYDESTRRVEIESRLKRDGECLIWTGLLDVNGYGIVSWHGRRRRVHVLMHEWHIGPIPDGLEPDHLCRVHACAEPSHLEPVTHRVNMLRGQTVAARNAAKTHCVNGHEFTEGNTRIRRNARECRTCTRERQRKTHQTQAA